MNEWARRSAKLAGTKNYLDRLQDIYPAVPGNRNVSLDALHKIKQAVRNEDQIQLLDLLLDLDKFPFEESYKQFLKRDRGAVRRNPKTVHRICSMLFDMGSDGIIAGVTAPKSPNTMRGHQFRGWLTKSFRFVQSDAFKRSTRGVVFLDVSEKELRNYVNSDLGAGFAKRPDFVAKSDGKFVVGEAKFLGDEGGNQNAHFKAAMDMAGQTSGKAIKVAVIDGIVWLKNTSYYRQIQTSSVSVFSALVLSDFLKNGV